MTTATSLQSGMLFHAVAEPGTGVDIEQIWIELDEELDVERFRAAWQAIVDRHPIMRAYFAWGRAEPEIVFPDDVSLPLRVEDWSDRGPAEQGQLLAQQRLSDRLQDFDLFGGTLHRFFAAKLAPNSWRILWSFHHAILDGRSFPIVLEEVLTLYDGGLDAELAERPDFRRYVEVVSNRDLEPARRYWQEKLARQSSVSSIAAVVSSGAASAADEPGGSGPSVVPIERQLTETKTTSLRRLAARCGVSLNTCVQAGWYLLLHHHSQQNVVTFGTTRACRHVTPDAGDMIGLLINTVPMCLEVDDTESVEELLVRLRQEQLELRDHETTPLPIIRDCAPSSGDLFDSIVVFDDASLGARMDERFPDRAATRRFRYDGQTNFALTLLAYGDESMLLRLEADVERYGAAVAERLLEQLEMLLDGFVADASQPAVDVAYLSRTEVQQYREWNATDVDYELEQTLQSLFEAQVQRTPDAPALTCGQETLTYREFNERSNQLAHHLRHELGVGADTAVGVFTERSIDMMVAIYAIIKAGGAYVPLDPEHPADRLLFMAEDSAVNLVLTQRVLAGALPDGGFDVLIVDDTEVLGASDAPRGNPEPIAGPDHLAYLLYTSGSTGRPKGVMIEHRAIVNRLLWMQETYQLDGSDCVLQKTPYTFDVSVWELFWAMQVGARLVMAEPGGHRDTAYLAEVVQQHRVTTLHFVPSMLQLFVEEPKAGACASVTRVICSGEALPRALQDRLFEVLDVELHNLYGPTEAAVDVTWWACDADSALSTVPIGYPIANTEVHVLDPRMGRVPVGAQGELHIGGVQLARGYHNRPELTAEKFVTDPFSDRPGARLYKTGDLVRHLPDGAIDFLGRIDHQVKIRGQRIELGEIEAVIAGHGAVREAVVVASGATAAETQLVSYIVGDDPSQAELIEHCSALLPSYMVPGVWIMLEAFPLNLNGKVDRAALPAPEAAVVAREIVDPAGAHEILIADRWKSILGLEHVGVTEAFFDVGGNSLLLVRLAQQLTEAAGVSVSVRELLRYPTVRLQAQLLARTDEAESGADQAVEAGARQAEARRAGRSRRRARAAGK